MQTVPQDVRQRLRQYDQEHVLAWWDELTEHERHELLNQIQALDLRQLRCLYEERERSFAVPTADKIRPIPVAQVAEHSAEGRQLRRRGEEALRRGEVAALVVAGGQGSRLGFEHPKGMFPIGPVTNKSLFQIHSEKVLALSNRHGHPIPLLVMTSPATHQETEKYYREHDFFGLSADEVYFFCQGTMPALDMTTGKLLLEEKGKLFASPNGHGGTLIALADSGLLAGLQERGIRHVFYFQVDNPLVKVADPLFLGQHLEERSEVSAKVVRKESPTDKLGNLVLVDGRCTMIEYSDLPENLARQRDGKGNLRIWAGSPAIHIFAVDFLKRVTEGENRIPFHVARKKVPYLDAQGTLVKPEKENALKFEMFIFDVLPMAERWTIVETSRPEEFTPLKNATGADSPAVVQQALSDLAASWLSRADVAVPRRADGSAAVALEVSPLYALDAEEFAAKVDRSRRIEGPTYFDGDKVTR